MCRVSVSVSVRVPIPIRQLCDETGLMMSLGGAIRSSDLSIDALAIDQDTAASGLGGRRHINTGVAVKEVDRDEADFEDLAGHNREIFDAGHVLQAELDPDHKVLVLDWVLALRPAAYAQPPARLVGVFAACVQLAVGIAGDV